MPLSSSSSVEPDHHATQGDTEGAVSFMGRQHHVDAVCDKYGVPKDRYTARPAGDLRASSPPPPGCVCVYSEALEAGMRFPLNGFFCDVLAHFGIAPNGWRILAGFLVLCHSAGVPPSLPVFRYFFLLSIVNHKHRGCYVFRSRDTSGLRFKGMPSYIKDWKNSFFFLSSPEPWPFPVEWGEPSKSSFMEPVLDSEGKKYAAKLLRSYAGGAVDINTCLSDSNLAAAMAPAASAPPPSFTRIASDSKGMDPSVYEMMKNMLAEKAAAQASASAKKAKAEPDSHAPGSPPLCAKKRNLEEANSVEEPPRSLLNTPPLSGMCSPPPGFPISHDGDGTGWEAARELLQGAVAPPQHRAFAANEPSDVVAASYVAILQAANYVSTSLDDALELEEKLAARDAEVAALEKQLAETKGELAAARAERDRARGARAGALEEWYEIGRVAARLVVPCTKKMDYAIVSSSTYATLNC
ncbi:uncharacterized protein [Aegilops tauschii subsp. strangulata]|uniref:Transposase (putative) gypsy type domain-containing protein n=1 Tax=Aegilops tauschii subsp. strangulata TaxID=200361 RepID=A0A453QW40_AEGTS|nr:uncharacterized protein LOC109783710 isoform X2 [Aegilops tauschii subsp. strangulata]